MTERITMTLGDDGRPNLDEMSASWATLALYIRFLEDLLEWWLYTQDDDEDEEYDELPKEIGNG